MVQNSIEESLEKPKHVRSININCVDPLGRSAILIAIDNENFEMLKVLISNNVDTKDALLYAVSEEFVEAVELLLDCEEEKWTKGDPHVSKNITNHKNQNFSKSMNLFFNFQLFFRN